MRYRRIRRCVFPDLNGVEFIHGTGLPAAGYGIIQSNWFGSPLTGLNDVVDFSGGQRPNAILQVLDNVFTGGLGTSAFVAYMGALTDRRFTATQYALLSSLMGVPRVLASAPTGWLAEWLGWPGFFVLCTLIAIPGLILLRWMVRLAHGPKSA